jgi:hypothetical protein
MTKMANPVFFVVALEQLSIKSEESSLRETRINATRWKPYVCSCFFNKETLEKLSRSRTERKGPASN